MSLAEENILREISDATGANSPYRYGSGVDAFCNLAIHGPARVRGEILKLGIMIYGDKQNFEGLNRIFEGLTTTMTPTYLAEEIKRRMQEAMSKSRPTPRPAPITIQSLPGPGTPAMPPQPATKPITLPPPLSGYGPKKKP